MCEYNDDYVKELEDVAEAMQESMENMLSIVSPKREPLCGNIRAANQAELTLDRYYKLKRDHPND